MADEPIRTRELAPLPTREENAHKGDAGRVVVVGGAAGPYTMIGACALAANGAFRTGAGLVQLIVPSPIVPALATLTPCSTFRLMPPDGKGLAEMAYEFQADAVAVGPGLGTTISLEALVALLTEFDGPMVVDADALNLLAGTGHFELPSPRRIVLTPHPGEALRLRAGRYSTPAGEFKNTAEQRQRLALELVRGYGGAVVLKGAGTVVTDGQRLYINETGNPGMATAGMGDVLTGIILALLGQGLDSLDAAMLGTYLHGLAGDFASEELGRLSLMATDLIDFLPEAVCDYDGFRPAGDA
jgi:ADP-dependent NAD(P)H-hydrate dehydratase